MCNQLSLTTFRTELERQIRQNASYIENENANTVITVILEGYKDALSNILSHLASHSINIIIVINNNDDYTDEACGKTFENNGIYIHLCPEQSIFRIETDGTFPVILYRNNLTFNAYNSEELIQYLVEMTVLRLEAISTIIQQARIINSTGMPIQLTLHWRNENN